MKNMNLEELKETLFNSGKKSDFVHLHLHSDFSLKDGIGKPTQFVKIAMELGMPAIAITDHGSIGSHPSFFTFCRSNKIKPIVGAEIYLNDKRSELVSVNEKADKISEAKADERFGI